MSSGWRALEDARLERLFSNPCRFRAISVSEEGRELELGASFESHLLRVLVNEDPELPSYTLIVDGEPVGDLDRWPPNWIRVDQSSR